MKAEAVIVSCHCLWKCFPPHDVCFLCLFLFYFFQIRNRENEFFLCFGVSFLFLSASESIWEESDENRDSVMKSSNVFFLNFLDVFLVFLLRIIFDLFFRSYFKFFVGNYY